MVYFHNRPSLPRISKLQNNQLAYTFAVKSFQQIAGTQPPDRSVAYFQIPQMSAIPRTYTVSGKKPSWMIVKYRNMPKLIRFYFIF